MSVAVEYPVGIQISDRNIMNGFSTDGLSSLASGSGLCKGRHASCGFIARISAGSGRGRPYTSPGHGQDVSSGDTITRTTSNCVIGGFVSAVKAHVASPSSPLVNEVNERRGLVNFGIGSSPPLAERRLWDVNHNATSASTIREHQQIISSHLLTSGCNTSVQVCATAPLTDAPIDVNTAPSSSPCAFSNIPLRSDALDIAPVDLAARIKASNCTRSLLFLDCRSFIAFNTSHIAGAINICCSNRFTKKRLQCGKIQLADLVGGPEAKIEYNQKRANSDVIVYDDSSCEVEMGNNSCPSPLQLVLSILHKDGTNAVFLKGGLQGFQSQYSDLCAQPEQKAQQQLLFSPTTPIIDEQIDIAIASQVLPFLYIGNERDAANWDRLQELGITHVLNVTSRIPVHFEDRGIIYHRLCASDSGNQNLKQYFEAAFIFIEEARRAGGRVLIHCQAGVSRSSTITIAYIMKHSFLPMLQAFHYVKSKRPIIAPNFNFMGQLMELEQQLAEGAVSRDADLDIVQPSS